MNSPKKNSLAKSQSHEVEEEINQAHVVFEDWCEKEKSTDFELYVGNSNLSSYVANKIRERIKVARDLFGENHENSISTKFLHSSDLSGTEIGDFRLVSPLGQGGMGTVWLAEQRKRLNRLVAVKLIKPGFDSEEFVQRFSVEKQALASMSHPSIASVFDSGLTRDNRPYLAMEYIQGIDIVKYCEQHNLSIEKRLNLFLQLCNAIQHAHQKGIVHRDIKPSNILVTELDGKPHVKVIDFGLAKACEPKNSIDSMSITFRPMMLGSPLWMSPEQIKCFANRKSHCADTRSDVFSLGSVLYQLLTGTTPILPSIYQKASFDKLVEMIRTEVPQRPSSRLSYLTRTRGINLPDSFKKKLNNKDLLDLDWVVMKSIEKEPDRRYEGVAALANDIERFLNLEPVQARCPSMGYKLRILFRKYRLATTFGLVLIFFLLTGFAVSMFLANWALNERATALELKHAAIRAAATDREALDVITSGIPNEINELSFTEMNSSFYDVGAFIKRLENTNFKSDPEREVTFRLSAGHLAYRLRDLKIAKKQFLRALNLSTELSGESDEKTIAILSFAAKTSLAEGAFSESVELFERALRLTRKKPDDIWVLRTTARLAIAYHRNGQTAKSIELSEAIREFVQENQGCDRDLYLRIMGPLANFYCSERKYQKAIAVSDELFDYLNNTRLIDTPLLELECCFNLISAYEDVGQYTKGIRVAQRAVNIAEGYHTNTHHMAMPFRVSHARLLLKNGQTDKANTLLRQLLPKSGKGLNVESLYTCEVESLLKQLSDYTTFMSRMGSKSAYDIGDDQLSAGIKLLKRQIGSSEIHLTTMKKQLGIFLRRKKQLNKSALILEECLQNFEKYGVQANAEAIDTMKHLFFVYLSNQAPQKAIEIGEKLLRLNRASDQFEPSEEVGILSALSQAYDQSGDHIVATRLARKVLDNYCSNLRVEHKPTQSAFHRLRRLLIRNKKYDVALSLHRKFSDQVAKKFGNGHPYAIYERKNHAVALQILGRVHEATVEFRKVMQLCNDHFKLSMSDDNAIVYLGYYQNHLMAHSKFESAREVIGKWQALINKSKSVNSFNWKAWSMTSLAEYYASIREYGQSKEIIGHVFNLKSKMPTFPKYIKPANRELLRAKSILGLCLAHEGNFERAESLCIEACQKLKHDVTCTKRPYHRWYLVRSIDRLVKVYQLAGKSGKVQLWKKQRELMEEELKNTLHTIQIL